MPSQLILISCYIVAVACGSSPHRALAQDRGLPSNQATNSENDQVLFNVIDKNRASHVAFFQELVQTQTGGEEAIVALLSRRLNELGGAVEEVPFLPKELTLKDEFAAEETLRPHEGTNIVGAFPGSGGGRSLVLFAHHDVFDVPAVLDWTHDPFAGDIEENRIIGWGVADDFGGIAIMVEALSALRLAGLRPKGDVYLCGTISKSNSRGIVAILERGYGADASIYLHPAESGVGLREIQTASAGVIRLRISVAGMISDASEPGSETPFAHQGVNAVDKGILIIQALKELDEDRGKRIYYKAFDDKVGRSTNLLVGHVSSGDEESVSEVPTEFTIGVYLTFPPNERLADVRKEIEAAVSDTVASDAWLKEHPPVIEWLIGTESTEVTVDQPIYQTVSNAIQVVTGVEPFVNPLHALNDIRNPPPLQRHTYGGLWPLLRLWCARRVGRCRRLHTSHQDCREGDS